MLYLYNSMLYHCVLILTDFEWLDVSFKAYIDAMPFPSALAIHVHPRLYLLLTLLVFQTVCGQLCYVINTGRVG